MTGTSDMREVTALDLEVVWTAVAVAVLRLVVRGASLQSQPDRGRDASQAKDVRAAAQLRSMQPVSVSFCYCSAPAPVCTVLLLRCCDYRPGAVCMATHGRAQMDRLAMVRTALCHCL